VVTFAAALATGAAFGARAVIVTTDVPVNPLASRTVNVA
jgi:hypothetical protein